MEVTIILSTGFQAITEDFLRPDSIAKGKQMVEHLSEVREERKGGKINIMARCIREMSIREDPYFIDLDIHPTSRRVIHARCSCVSGVSGLCKHTAALVQYINTQREASCTSGPPTWLKPKSRAQQLYPKGEKVEDLIGSKKTEMPTFKEDPERLECLASELEHFGLTSSSLYKMITKPPIFEALPVQAPRPLDAQIEALLLTPDLDPFCDKNRPETVLVEPFLSFWEGSVQLNDRGKLNIFLETLGQAQNKKWFQERKARISASMAHKIYRARKKETRLKYFFQTTVDLPNFKYGRETEPVAKEAYEKKTGNVVLDSGLVVKAEQPWLCGTPDGFVVSREGLFTLEIKCPVSCKDGPIDVDYVINGKLKESHAYFTQVQLQMYVCNVQKCHFFVFSAVDSILLHVDRDDHFL